jgi:hypothetical protein
MPVRGDRAKGSLGKFLIFGDQLHSLRDMHATGLLTSIAISKFRLIALHDRPWPEQRSIKPTSAPGASRSISAALCPMG